MSIAAAGPVVQPSSGLFHAGDWWCHRYPFRHWRARNLLDPHSYAHVAQRFRSILDNPDGPYRLRQTNANYDALILALNGSLVSHFDALITPASVESLCDRLSIPFCRNISAALHSSRPGSRNGWIHTDLCSGWFDDGAAATSTTLGFSDNRRCDYFTGARNGPDAEPREYVRAGVLIYYLCNDGWATGDGGETALYRSAVPARDNEELVAPVNNTALVFECTPHSYHRFISNPKRTRNSIIFWVHMPIDEALARWPRGIRRGAPR